MALEGISKRFSSLRHFCSGIRRRLRTTQVVTWSKDNVAIFGRDQKLEATTSSVENKFNMASFKVPARMAIKEPLYYRTLPCEGLPDR
jgi:hypothetical protein